MQYEIRIEAPCDQGWDHMTPNDQGRHCDRCCKTVVDFTEWPLDDIARYLQEMGKGNVCGHFRGSQLNTPFETPETLAQKVWQTAIPLYRKIAAVIILFFAVTISSCGTENTNKGKPQTQTTTGEPKPHPNKIHFDGGPSIVPIKPAAADHSKTSEVAGDNTAKHKPNKPYKTPKTVEANIDAPEVQGAVEVTPVDTAALHHNIAPNSDATNK